MNSKNKHLSHKGAAASLNDTRTTSTNLWAADLQLFHYKYVVDVGWLKRISNKSQKSTNVEK